MKMKNAKWIWYGYPGYDLVNSWMEARRVFSVSKIPKRAIIYVTADTRYRLYVNGRHVSRGPARGFQESWPYDEVDIARYLTRGRNVISALVHNTGVGTFQYIHQGFAGFLLWGGIGGRDISTNDSWRVRPAPGYGRNGKRVSLQLGYQEFFDAHLEDDSWQLPKYDDSGWQIPLCRNYGTMPWPTLEKRGIPLLRERIKIPKSIVSIAKGISRKKFLETNDIVDLYFREKMKWKTVEDNDTQIKLKIKDKIRASFNSPPTGTNGYMAYCLDFGKEVVGSIQLNVEGATGKEIIDTVVCESVSQFTPDINLPSTEWCKMAFGNRLILRRGKIEHEQFDHWGFRYLVIIVRHARRMLKISVSLQSVTYPLEIKSEWESSNELLNQIYQMSVHTQQSCMLDVYVDCPWREQAQWWGDARIQGANTFYLSADIRLFKRGLRQIGTQQLDNGLTYGHAPTVAHECILPDFTLIWLMTHWDYYWQTGDLALFNEMKSRVHRALKYFHHAIGKNGLLAYDDRYWLFLDWSDIFKDGHPTLYNLLYLMALKYVVRLFKLSGDTQSARLYSIRARKLEACIQKRLWNPRKKSFYGGLSWGNKPVIHESSHNYAIAILLDLFPEEHEIFLKRHLVPMVKGRPTGKRIPSPYFMYYIFEALKKKGHEIEVIDCIKQWWGDWVSKGYSTTPEVWQPKPGSHSLCHAWSAHPMVHFYTILLGIKQLKPGWKEIEFSPCLSHIDFVRGKLMTPLGIIHAGWEKKDSTFQYYLNLPKGMFGKIKTKPSNK